MILKTKKSVQDFRHSLQAVKSEARNRKRLPYKTLPQLYLKMDQTNAKPVRRWRKGSSNEKISLRPSARGDSSSQNGTKMTPKVSFGSKKPQKTSQKQYEDDSRSTMSKPGSLLDEGIRAEIDRLSDDSDYDCDRYAISVAIGTS